MTEDQLLFGGFINTHCKFFLNDGNILQGVIVTSPEDEHGRYCFVTTNNMKQYQALGNEGKTDEKKLLSAHIDFALIDRCENL